MPELPIAVAMSGGVDSSMVAAMLVREGRTVVGMTMQLWNQRRLPELAVGGRHRTLLFAGRCLRRAPRGRADRHSLLRGQLRAAVRRARGEAVRGGVSRRAHADSLHAVQQLHQVRSLPGDGRFGGRALYGHRPLRARALRPRRPDAINCCARWTIPKTRPTSSSA